MKSIVALSILLAFLGATLAASVVKPKINSRPYYNEASVAKLQSRNAVVVDDDNNDKPNIIDGSPSEQSRQLSDQQLICYDYFGLTGSSLTLFDYAPYLGNFNFDNKASSCCFNGIWMLYDNADYNNALNPASPVFYAWGENYCTDFNSAFDNKATSVRFSGAPDGYKYDTINFYEGEYFIGREQYTYGDQPQLNYDNFGSSVIVTGCTAWTLYEFDNYQGRSVCLYPADTFNCYPAFYTTRGSLGGMAGVVSSVRRGCFSTNVVRSDVADLMEKDGVVGQKVEFVGIL